MSSARLLLAIGLAVAACRPALAEDVHAWIGAPDCRLAAVKPAPAAPPTWSGGCKDGYAEGKGVLEWRTDKGDAYRLSATLHAGVVQGEGELRYPNGGEYTGTLQDGVPEGHGYYHAVNGNQFQGEIHAGLFDGPGEILYYTGDAYRGQLKDDEPDGVGAMTYALGGRYAGPWREGKWSGSGKLVYAGLPLRDVATVDGRDPNRPKRPQVEKTYTVNKDNQGSMRLLPLVVGRSLTVPPALGYQELSPEQQAMVNSWFPALAPGDEPPYPLHGPAQLIKLLSKIAIGKAGVTGRVGVYVTVGTDGKASAVKAVGLDRADDRTLVARIAAAIDYKPARCAGQPCEMVYPFNTTLSWEEP